MTTNFKKAIACAVIVLALVFITGCTDQKNVETYRHYQFTFTDNTTMIITTTGSCNFCPEIGSNAHVECDGGYDFPYVNIKEWHRVD